MRSHKYIAKIGSGTNARYFYTQEEYDAYRNSISRPHSRTPKYAKTWYGATETATVSKGNKVGLKTGIRKAKKGTPVSGAPSEHLVTRCFFFYMCLSNLELDANSEVVRSRLHDGIVFQSIAEISLLDEFQTCAP